MTESATRTTRGLYDTFPRKWGAAPAATHYCPGCGHGIAHKLIAEALAELGLQDRAIVISPVGCAVFAYFYFDCGNIQAAHGRAPALATALTRTLDRPVIVSYQGDGDLGSIGLNQTMQAANRGERMVIFFINNAVYGMTGGQMAPTSLAGQKTTTTPQGRDVLDTGYPLKICEVLSALEAPVYIERCSLADIKRIHQARRAIRKALEIQRDGKGFALVELLSPCPTNLHLDPVAASDFVTAEMEKTYPLGCFRDRSATAAPWPAPAPRPDLNSLFAAAAAEAPPPQLDPAFGEIRIKLAGHGGQGVLSMGMVLAAAAQKAGRHVSWFPSYGPEQRGGTANCSVVISGSPVGSPVVSRMDVLVALNQPALERFAVDVKPGGLILYEAASATAGVVRPEVRVIATPATALATEAGAPKAMNTAMLGVLAATAACRLPVDVFPEALADAFAAKPALLAPNRRVFDAALAWLNRQP